VIDGSLDGSVPSGTAAECLGTFFFAVVPEQGSNLHSLAGRGFCRDRGATRWISFLVPCVSGHAQSQETIGRPDSQQELDLVGLSI
jgi:hypothetical protein